VVAVLVTVLFARAATPLADAAATLFGVVYPAALAGAAVALRTSDAPWLATGASGDAGGFWLLTTVLVCVWGADTFAYFAGRAFGRHPLFPRVSPKKTWEGSAGGALGALALAAGFKLAVPALPLTWTDVVVIGLACGVASQLGDLVESLFKRSVDVKDSATWLPGHGGMLDRLDAAIVAIPLVAAWFALTRGL
jgi:phosphatidate cytidylyltransferase